MKEKELLKQIKTDLIRLNCIAKLADLKRLSLPETVLLFNLQPQNDSY